MFYHTKFDSKPKITTKSSSNLPENSFGSKQDYDTVRRTSSIPAAVISSSLSFGNNDHNKEALAHALAAEASAAFKQSKKERAQSKKNIRRSQYQSSDCEIDRREKYRDKQRSDRKSLDNWLSDDKKSSVDNWLSSDRNSSVDNWLGSDRNDSISIISDRYNSDGHFVSSDREGVYSDRDASDYEASDWSTYDVPRPRASQTSLSNS